MRRLVLGLVFAFVLLLASAAEAQRTGGSFGGRRFGSGGRAARTTPYRGGAYRGGSGVPFVFFLPGGGGGLFTLLVIGGVVILLANGARRAAASPLPGAQSRVWENVDLGVVQIAVDGATRRAIDEAIASRHLHARPRDRGAVWLREVIQELRARRDAWRAVRVDDYRPMSPPMAAGSFRRVQEGARSAALGAGLDVITIAVASHREIVDVRRSDADAAEHVMRALTALEPDDIVALDIVWSDSL